jgi:signal peptidase I
VYDRLVVDKIRYAFCEPSRWDIGVFKYPIRQNQNYVKRIVGMPGDRLRISGGNVHLVAAGTDGRKAEDLTTLRKPALLQSEIWKEIFPARMVLNEHSTLLGKYFVGRGTGDWSEADGTLSFEPRSPTARATLLFSDSDDGGISDQVWDGYPTWIAKLMRDKEPRQLALEQVQDARIDFTMLPAADIARLWVEIGVRQQGDKTFRFQLAVDDGQARVEVREFDEVKARSEPFALALRAGRAVDFSFAHVDDWLVAEVDGFRAELDTGAFKTLDPPKSVTLQVQVQDGGRLQFSNLRVWRDLHYLPSSNPGGDPMKIIEVPGEPDPHYLMLGDNTQQSVDSRDWTQLTIAVENNQVVDPATHPNAVRMSGNLRAFPLSEPPDPDENPVPVTSRGKIVFTDTAGEVWALDGQPNLDGGTDGRMWGPGAPWFQGESGPWKAPTSLVQFAPRRHIIGRPLLNFWPVMPFRLGLIR